MTAIVYRLRAEARSDWLTWVGVAVLVGLVGGVTMALVAGARRTDGVYDRFLARSNPSDLIIPESSDFGTNVIDVEAIAALPGVRGSTLSTGWFAILETADGRRIFPQDAFEIVDSGAVGDRLDTQLILEGRAADATNPHEIVVGFELAEEFGIELGDVLVVRTISAESAGPAQLSFLATLTERAASPEPEFFPYEDVLDGPKVEVEVVGIGAAPLEFTPRTGDLPAVLRVTPGFEDLVGDRAWSTRYLKVQLDSTMSVSDFQRQIASRAAGESALTFNGVAAKQADAVKRGFHLQAVGFLMLGVLFGLVGLITVAQATARLVSASGRDVRTLQAMGWDALGLVGLAVARNVVVVAIGAPLAVAMAVGMSSVWPVGDARHAEVEPGLRFDGAVLLIGTLLAVVIVPALAVWPAWMQARRPTRSSGSSRRRTRHLRSGPTSVRLGTSFATGTVARGGRIPVRSSVAGIAVSIALVAFLVVFEYQFDRLAETPSAYGWNWDVQIGTPGQPAIAEPLVAGLRENGDVAGAAVGSITSVEVDGQRVDVLAVDDEIGAIRPTMLAGEPPVKRSEIALARRTLTQLDVRIGDFVEVSVGQRAERFRVVGEVVIPVIGDQGRLGTGGMLTAASLSELVPTLIDNVALVEFEEGREVSGRENIIAATTPVTSRVADASSALGFRDLGPALERVLVVIPLLIVAATIANVLATSVRRRRVELATLRAVGATRGQVRRTVLVQGLTTSMLALLVGLPLGVSAARLVWVPFSSSLGFRLVQDNAIVPVIVLFGVVVVLTALVTAVPAWLAASGSPARSLRDE